MLAFTRSRKSPLPTELPVDLGSAVNCEAVIAPCVPVRRVFPKQRTENEKSYPQDRLVRGALHRGRHLGGLLLDLGVVDRLATDRGADSDLERFPTRASFE
jgi:hypothetical protein